MFQFWDLVLEFFFYWICKNWFEYEIYYLTLKIVIGIILKLIIQFKEKNYIKN